MEVLGSCRFTDFTDADFTDDAMHRLAAHLRARRSTMIASSLLPYYRVNHHKHVKKEPTTTQFAPERSEIGCERWLKHCSIGSPLIKAFGLRTSSTS